MMEVGHMDKSRALLWIVAVIFSMAMMYGDQLAGAHQFAIQNQLDDSVLVECHSAYRNNGEQELWSGKRYVYAWFEKLVRPEDWICGFSWLGTTNVKQFFVWNHTTVWGPMSCDMCEWTVDPSGFSLKVINLGRTDNHFMYDWDTSCLSSS